jgi:hypothetical protein
LAIRFQHKKIVPKCKEPHFSPIFRLRLIPSRPILAAHCVIRESLDLRRDMSIKNEEAFYEFMEVNGPNAVASKRNYISWLRFVDQTVRDIDNIKSAKEIDEIYQILIAESKKRQIYTTARDASNIKSALRKYWAFTIWNKNRAVH